MVRNLGLEDFSLLGRKDQCRRLFRSLGRVLRYHPMPARLQGLSAAGILLRTHQGLVVSRLQNSWRILYHYYYSSSTYKLRRSNKFYEQRMECRIQIRLNVPLTIELEKPRHNWTRPVYELTVLVTSPISE